MRNVDFFFFLCEGVWEKCVTSGMVGNFNQLHQLQEWVEHLLRSSKKKWSGASFLWSGVELLVVFGYFFMEWSQNWWSGVLPNTP